MLRRSCASPPVVIGRPEIREPGVVGEGLLAATSGLDKARSLSTRVLRAFVRCGGCHLRLHRVPDTLDRLASVFRVGLYGAGVTGMSPNALNQADEQPRIKELSFQLSKWADTWWLCPESSSGSTLPLRH